MFSKNCLIENSDVNTQAQQVSNKGVKKLKVLCRKYRFLLRIAQSIPITRAIFEKCFNRLAPDEKDAFAEYLLKEPEHVKQYFLLHISDSYICSSQSAQNLLMSFVEQCSRDMFQGYLKQHSAMSAHLQNTLHNILINLGKWDYVNDCVEVQHQVQFIDKGKFVEFVNYNQSRPEIINQYLQKAELGENFLLYFAQEKLWTWISHYCTCHPNFTFQNGVLYAGFREDQPYCSSGKVSLQAEAMLFDNGYETVLLQVANNNQLQHRSNKLKFLTLIDKFPQDVVKYFHAHEQELALTDDEQVELMQKCINICQCFSWISFKAEALLLSADYRNYLFKYIEQRQFQYHENEFNFLMMYQYYPQEIEGYLSKYGKNLILTNDERRQFEPLCRKNWVVHMNITTLVAFKRVVLPELRRKRCGFTQKDLPRLIRLSMDNPLLLRKYIETHGQIDVEYEPELFFCAEKTIRDNYVYQYGVNYPELIRQACRFGATSQEQNALQQSWNYISGYAQRVNINLSPRCLPTKQTVVNISREMPVNCNFCAWYYAGRAYNRDNSSYGDRCFDSCSKVSWDVRYQLVKNLEQTTYDIRNGLYNIANRNYLTAQIC